MTAEEVKQSITGWCSSDNDLEITGERQEPMTDFALGLRVGGVSGSPVELEVLQGQGADRLTVRRTASVAGDTGAAKQLIDSRPGSVSAQIARSNGDTSVTAQTFVYLDGLNKHSFVQAVSELARTSRLLDGLGAAGATTAQPAAAAEPATVAAATSQPMPAPSFTPAAQPAPQPQPQPQPQPATPQWVPNHQVPAQGMRAWAAPDPNGPVVANLAPGLPIQVTEVRGAWARVVCSNGWTGWVDGRIIGIAA